MLHFNSLSVPMEIVPRATLGTRAVDCRRLVYIFTKLLVLRIARHCNPP
jgi:hypothetical protein